MEHILLEKAFTYPEPIKISDPDNCYYDDRSGYWKDFTGKAAINNSVFRVGETKKCDIETGEDQKGEFLKRLRQKKERCLMPL